MVYIDSSGQVLDRRPWSVKRLIGIFVGLWFLLVQFTRTLLAPFRRDKYGSDRNIGRRDGWGGGGGGWGGGGGGPGSGGPGGGPKPNRRIGRINNSMDCNAPMGGCSSCG